VSQLLKQTPGIGGLDEITDAEEQFLQNISGLSYSAGDLLYHNGSDLVNLGIGTPSQVLQTNAEATAPEWSDSGAAGEANTASNTGTLGTGIFKQKVGVDLELYKIASANNRLTVALSGTDYLNLTLVEANIDHDALTNFVAGEHFLQSAITTVGIIGTGEWQGTAVADTYIASAATWNAKQDALPVVDTQTIIKGSVDATKLVRFEVDGLTTATTRILTVPDKDITIADNADLHSAVTIGTANGLSLSTQALSLALASTSATGALSDTDWNTFNDKAEADQTMYIGTTGVAINRASAALTLAGITLTTPDIGTPSAGNLANCTFPTLNQNTTGTAAGLSSTLAIASGGTGSTTLAGASIPTYTSTNTFTNKRITSRVGTVADAATITPVGDSNDLYTVTALAQAATIAAPSGTPTNGQKLIIRIKDNGTTRSLTWNAIYNVVGVTLPTDTTAGKTHYIGCMYNTANTKWDVLAITEEA